MAINFFTGFDPSEEENEKYFPPKHFCPGGLEAAFHSVQDPETREVRVTLYHGAYSYEYSLKEYKEEAENDWPWLRAICKLAGHHAFPENPYFASGGVVGRAGPSFYSNWMTFSNHLIKLSESMSDASAALTGFGENYERGSGKSERAFIRIKRKVLRVWSYLTRRSSQDKANNPL